MSKKNKRHSRPQFGKAVPPASKDSLFDVIKREAPDALRGLPPHSVSVLEKSEIRHVSRSGPLPSPDDLAAYNSLIPNGAERIMAMAERQSANRIQLEDHVIKEQQRQSSCGQKFAFIIGLVGIIAGGVVGTIGGEPYLGGIISTATITSLAVAFITGKAKQKQSLILKSPQNKDKNVSQ